MRRLLTALAILALVSTARAAEIRDVATVVGVRPNQIIGYGLVVGLNGTGDRGGAALKAGRRMLDKLGYTLSSGELRSKNLALVMVMAKLPADVYEGREIDVSVSSIGDATSLYGGRLISTPLHAADPAVVFARAQGAVTFGGAEKPLHPTSGKVFRGATVERDLPVKYTYNNTFKLALKHTSFALAQNVADAINNYLWRAGQDGTKNIAEATSPGLVTVTIPEWERKRPVSFIEQALRYPVDVDLPARVVVNEATGTVAVNEAVRVGPAAVSHGDLYVEIPASRPAPGGPIMAGGKGKLIPVSQGVTLQEVVTQLNRMKVSPRDLIAVLEKLIQIGALNAELVVE